MTARKPKPQVHMVVDTMDNPGRVYAVFFNIEDARDFAGLLAIFHGVEVESRTLFYGQPPNRGYNQ